MSEARTSKIENAPPNNEALLNSEQADDALVDRTQQLIDEVNQLLGTSDSSPDPAAKEPEATPAIATTPDKTDGDLGDAAATLKSFLDSLGGEVPMDSGETSDAEPPQLEVDSLESDAIEPRAIASEQPSDSDSEESSFDLEALKAAFSEEVPVEEEAVEEVAVEEVAVEEVAVEEVAVEEVAVEAVTVEAVTVEEPVSESDDPATAEVATAPELEEKSTLEDDDFEKSPESEAKEEIDEAQDITQKYLDELRSTFADELKEAEASERIESGVAADSDAPSVESWLASNVGEVSDEEESAEDEKANEDLPNAGGFASVADTDGESKAEPAEVEASKSIPAMALESQNDLVESESFGGGELAKLQASFDSSLKNLENRIGGMFSTISDQINQLLQSGIASSQGQSIVAGESEDAADAESDTPESESVETPQPKVDGDKVEVLKEQLKSKLREAEIELSINRAKLSQQRASVEQLQADLERREAAVEAKLAQAKKTAASGEKKGGIMDRWKRHLGE